jgi:hypothetical protein
MTTEDQPPAAAAAEDRALEIVGVLLGAISREPMRRKRSLNLLEDLRVDNRLVTPLALDAPAGHDPDVVVVAEHLVDAIAAERLGGPLLCLAGPQANLIKHLAQRRDRVLPGRERLEAQLHQLDPLGINRDRAHLLSVDHFPNVHVPDRRYAVGAAISELAIKTHLDLLAVRARAVGIDPGHYRKEQHPSVVVGDVLKRGLQLGAVALDLREQPEGVDLLTSDP